MLVIVSFSANIKMHTYMKVGCFGDRNVWPNISNGP